MVPSFTHSYSERVVLSVWNVMHKPCGFLVSGDNKEEIHVEWGERPTFLMTKVLHRQILIKSLSTAVCYTQTNDHETLCGKKIKILTAALDLTHVRKIWWWMLMKTKAIQISLLMFIGIFQNCLNSFRVVFVMTYKSKIYSSVSQMTVGLVLGSVSTLKDKASLLFWFIIPHKKPKKLWNDQNQNCLSLHRGFVLTLWHSAQVHPFPLNIIHSLKIFRFSMFLK